MPSYTHTRADGPFDPCPQCLREMPKEDLRALIGDLRMTVDDLREQLREARTETAIRPMDPTTNGDALGYLIMLAKLDANGGELDLIEKCEEYLRAVLTGSDTK